MTAGYSDLEGRVVIITGGGQGIGRTYAHAFARAGATPVIADLNGEAAQRVATEVEDKGGKALAFQTDIALAKSVDDMVAATLEAFGRIDVLVNNAALYMRNLPPATSLIKRPFEEIPLEEWEQLMRVNVTGSFLCARAVVHSMRKAQWGRIINTSSSTVLLGLPGYLHYVTSKAAIIGMTRSLARELGKDGINVNTIIPGLTQTEVANPTTSGAKVLPLQCIPRTETPEDLAPVVLFLASDASRFITGQSINVDGGSAHI